MGQLARIAQALAAAMTLAWAGGALAGPVTLVTLSASGSGSCTLGGCNNIDTSLTANPLTQNVGGFDTAYGWWAMDLPTLATGYVITGATLSIWNPGAPVNADSPGMGFYAVDAINFAALGDQSDILGSWDPASSTQASAAQFVTYAFGGFTLPRLSDFAGGQLLFAANPNGVHGPNQFEAFFGGSGGFPVATLTLAITAPEPGTWALMSLGFLGLGSALRGHQRRNRIAEALAVGD